MPETQTVPIEGDREAVQAIVDATPKQTTITIETKTARVQISDRRRTVERVEYQSEAWQAGQRDVEQPYQVYSVGTDATEIYKATIAGDFQLRRIYAAILEEIGRLEGAAKPDTRYDMIEAIEINRLRGLARALAEYDMSTNITKLVDRARDILSGYAGREASGDVWLGSEADEYFELKEFGKAFLAWARAIDPNTAPKPDRLVEIAEAIIDRGERPSQEGNASQ